MIINNKEEFEDFYPYSKDQIREYPETYPCVCKCEHVDGGLMGDYRQVYVIYFPKDTTIEDAFIQGLNARWKRLR